MLLVRVVNQPVSSNVKMAGDATETRKKLLAAATAEFAARGIAGARVDRIAAEPAPINR